MSFTLYSRRFVGCIFWLMFLLAFPQAADAQSAPPRATARSTYNSKPVFVENRGQWDGDFLYRTRAGGMTFFLERTGWVFSIEKYPEKAPDQFTPMIDRNRRQEHFERGVAVRMRFSGGARPAVAIPENLSPGVHNYFLGNDESRWRTEIPLYESVRLSQIWPGIEVVARVESGHFKYDLLVSPGADLSTVVIEVDGASGLELEADGSLAIETTLGRVRQPKPLTWQVKPSGEREEVNCDYVHLGGGRFGFAAPNWDENNALVIDPALLFSTFLGGTADDIANSVSVDSSGVATTAGSTIMGSLVSTPGAFSPTVGLANEAFVARLNSTGDSLVFLTVFGGAGTDTAWSLTVDGTGDVIVAGETGSTNFPTTPAAFQATYGGGTSDAFLLRLNHLGNALVYSSFYGGVAEDRAVTVALDAGGSALIGGWTASTNIPVTSGAFDSTYNGGLSDSFVARFNPWGSGLSYATLLGGTGDDRLSALALEVGGGVTVMGETSSPNFPTTSGAFDATFNGGGYDLFVTRLTPSGSALGFSTYLGGTSDDQGTAIAVAPNGETVVAGYTASTDFPTAIAAYGPLANGGIDGFVARLSVFGSQLMGATYVGGGMDDFISALALQPDGDIVVVGHTYSSDFPITAYAFDATPNGNADMFILRLSSDISALTYSTFIGGSAFEDAYDLAIEGSGALTVVGITRSTDFPTTAGALDVVYGAALDAVLFRLMPPLVVITQQPMNAEACIGGPAAFTIVAGGNVAFSYQWRRSGNPIAGAVGPSLAIPSVTSADLGIYDCVLSDGLALRVSESASLSVGPLVLTLGQFSGPSSFDVLNTCGIPGALYVTALTFEPANGTNLGGGWWAGLHIPLIELSIEVAQGYAYGPSVPFVGILDGSGSSTWGLPPGSVPPGLPPLYGVTRMLTPDWLSFLGDSNVAVITF